MTNLLSLRFTSKDAGEQLVETLKAGRLRVRIPNGSLGFFVELILPATLWPWGSTQLLTEMFTRDIYWGLKAAGM